MLSPHELRKDDFSRSIRGYSSEEVDEHINYIIEKYTELYRANDVLERKLRTALSQIDAFKNDEQSIRTALINAQKASSAIINEATEKADSIIQASKNTCNQILQDFDERIKEKRDTLYKMQRLVELFKKSLFEEYQQHIQKIEKLTFDEENDFTNWSLPDDYFVRSAKSKVESDVSENITSSPFEIKSDDVDGTIKADVASNAILNDASAVTLDNLSLEDERIGTLENDAAVLASDTASLNDNADTLDDTAHLVDDMASENDIASLETDTASAEVDTDPLECAQEEATPIQDDALEAVPDTQKEVCDPEDEEDIFADEFPEHNIPDEDLKKLMDLSEEDTLDDDLESDFEKFLTGDDMPLKEASSILDIDDSDAQIDSVSDHDIADVDVSSDIDVDDIDDIDYEDDIDFESLLEGGDADRVQDKDQNDDYIIASRSDPMADSGSVKDAIKALNNRLKNESSESPEADDSESEEKLSDEEDEFIKLLRSVTASAEKKRHNASGDARDQLTKTDEFDLEYNNNNKKK